MQNVCIFLGKRVTNHSFIKSSANSLIGTIPSYVAQWTSLVALALDSNEFSGYFPQLTELSNLTFVGASNNSFNGTFPLISSQPVYLDLSYNDFWGTIPHGIGLLSKLEYANIRSFANCSNSKKPKTESSAASAQLPCFCWMQDS